MLSVYGMKDELRRPMMLLVKAATGTAMVSDDHYSETRWAEHKKLVCREWRTAFQLLQLAAKNEECIVAAGIRPVRGTFAQLAENSGGFSHPNHTAHSGCYS